jgi:hypothetical protein
MPTLLDQSALDSGVGELGKPGGGEVKPTEGKIAAHQEITVTCCQMRDWEPERIERFFAGIAQMIRCAASHHFESSRASHCTPSAPPR